MATETQSTKLARIEADSTARFDRIENKIDKLAEALIALARVEEKMMSVEQNNNNNFERMNRFSNKLDEIEKKVDANAHTVAIINKVVYLIDLYTQSKHEELVILILYLFYLGISLCFMIRIFRTFGKLLGMVCLKHYEFYVLNQAHVFQEITGINLTTQKIKWNASNGYRLSKCD